jgi:hypothetical protein
MLFEHCIKGHVHQGPSRNNVARGIPEGLTLNGIRDRDLREQLPLRKEGTSGRIFRKTV